jgi:hypothetical protein|nr:MAG TPA: Major tail protein [Bacteriophage sp.]
MERDFPHLGDTPFPHLSNVDVWKYRNNFDYGRWEDNARIKMCSVNWDSSYVNVVEWKTDKARDTYFDNLAGYKVDEPTMFQMQPDGSVKVPVPFNAATQYNYIVLDYPVMSTPDNPVSYAAPARNRFLYFCEAVEELAPNTTLCHVQLDVWSTYINSVDVSGMMLARGHAPMASVTATDYLKNPYANQAMLTAPDVTFGTFARTPSLKSHIFNGEVLAVITMSATSWGIWGTKAAGTWRVPAEPLYLDDTPSLLSLSVAPANLAPLLTAMKTEVPQAFQTIRAVWFAPVELVETGEPYTFAGTSVRRVFANPWTDFEVAAWSKSDFGYPAKCDDMAKLYTYPYARIMAHTDAGDIEVKVEETEGNISVAARLNLAGPFINVDTYVHLGGASASLAFAATGSITMPWAGDALKTLRSLEIPSFAVYLDAGTVNDYATHFDRAQANTALQNAYTSATASAKTALDNGIDSVDLSIANLATSVSAALAVLAESQDMENTVLGNTIEVNNILTNNANLLTQTITGAQNEVAAVSNMNNVNAAVQSGQLALGMAAGQGIAQAVSMDFSGALNTAASNFQYAFNQTTSMQANTANVGIAITTREEITSATKQSNSVRNTEGNQLNLINTRRKQRAETTNLNTETTSQTTQNNRSAKVNKANMQRGYNTNVANAGRSRSTALSAIENGIKQAALGAPLEGGAFANAATASSRPLGWVFEVQTQDTGSIMAAASHFARYGYALGQYWDFTSWQVMRDFTYWQCDDVWIIPRACTQGAASLIRSILIEGTTVWREPAIIGATDIWEN